MDTLVFDIETQNFFTDPGVGWNNFGALKISVVGVYSYLKNKYFSFEEDEMAACAKLFRGAERLVGFSSNRYDVPVLNLYFQKIKARPVKSGKAPYQTLRVATGQAGISCDGIISPGNDGLDLWKKERVDLLEEIEMATGARISLSKLAEANLGEAKDHHGSEAIGLYNEGRMKELKAYCLKDVRLTKELYDLYKNRRHFFIPDRATGEMAKVEFLKPQTLF